MLLASCSVDFTHPFCRFGDLAKGPSSPDAAAVASAAAAAASADLAISTVLHTHQCAQTCAPWQTRLATTLVDAR